MKEAVPIKKVLIVDDNAAVLEVVSELVASAGFTPLTASGGRECLTKVDADRPDLILLDINMPDLDGWSVLRELKQKGLTDGMKVMMLTATTDVSTDIFGLQDVVSGYIRKPFNNKELADRLRAVLEGPSESLLVSAEKEAAERPGLLGRLKGGRVAPSGMEKAVKSAKLFDLRRGFGYVVKEKKPQKSFEIFVDQVMHNIQGLCISRQHPDIIRKEWGLEKTPIIWLSNQLGKVYVNPTN
ncbi:MAG: response regulator, partial [Euryarchaeota archaeon]|nr:response regulator [Euryarchaeota archaeon]